MGNRSLASPWSPWLIACLVLPGYAGPVGAKVLNGKAAIRGQVFGTPLVVGTSARVAGAIDSITWNGMQFVNAADHGRELQSAASFDGLGECYNPTEAGSGDYPGSAGVSRGDGTGGQSTSRLLKLTASGNRLETTVRMAFWTPAGQPYPSGCGTFTGKDGKPLIAAAQNRIDLSTVVLHKTISIGYAGIPNVIAYTVAFHVVEAHRSATFEALTGYMPKIFSSFWTFSPASGSLRPLSHDAGEQNMPIIFSTADQRYAMGIYTPMLPQASFPSAGYGRFDFAADGTMKWNMVFRPALRPPPADYTFPLFVVIGSLRQVETGMTSVFAAASHRAR